MGTQHKLTTKKPGKALFWFTVPMIIGNLFQQFYNMVDSAIVGKYEGVQSLAAVGASYSFTTVFIMIAIGGGMGAAVLTSQFFGAKKYGKMKTAVSTFLITFLVVSIVLALIGFFVNPYILRFLKTPEDVIEEAILYLQIYFVGLPFMFMYNILSAEFNALGHSKIPLALLMFSSILNIILDVWMVRDFGWGVAGVAIATVIAQGVSVIISFGILLFLLKKYKDDEPWKVFDWSMFTRGTKIAIPSVIQQSIVSIGLLLTQSAVNAFGAAALAGYTAAARLESICIVPMIATGNAMSTFTAQNIGAKKEERVKEGYKAAAMIVFAFGVIIILISQLFYESIIRLFINDMTNTLAYNTGVSYFRFIGWFVSFLGLKTITDGILRGSGDVTVYMIANLINLGIRVAVAQLLSPIFGIEFVWYAVPIGWIVNAVISYIWYRTGNWKRKSLVAE